MQYEECYQKFINENPYPRKFKSLELSQGFSSIYLRYNGRELINFSSSDYLGLSRHPLLIQRSQEYAKAYGVGLSSSRLVSGNLVIFDELEKKLALAINKPAALILGAGYQTNISVLEALLDNKVLNNEPIVFCDRLAHASMIATTRYIARIQRFQHNDLNHLETLLNKQKYCHSPKFILTESIYSMEGDQADLQALVFLANKYHAFLYVDDAHSVGVYGSSGWGSSADFADEIPLIMGTFSKALGSFGAYVGCSENLKEYLINKCKGLIYSTGLSPAILGAISAVIDLLPELQTQREKVLNNATKLRDFFKKNNLNYGTSSTHIVPWIIGDAKQAVQAAKELEIEGILGTAIQPPTVPVGGSRIRFCLTAEHSDADVQSLMDAVLRVAGRL